MRYLLLSVLVVCMIGVMIPSVFGETYTIFIADETFGTSYLDEECKEVNLCLFPYELYVEKGDSVSFYIEHEGYKRSGPFGSDFINSGSYAYGYDNLLNLYHVRACTSQWDCMASPYYEGTIQMNQIGEFFYNIAKAQHLDGKIIVTEKGEYDIAEKHIAAKTKYELLQKLKEDYDTLDAFSVKMSCYSGDRIGETGVSVCTEVVEELKTIAGDSWNESFESVFNYKIIRSEERVPQKVAFPIMNQMRDMIIDNYVAELEILVSNAEDMVKSNSEITLESQTDIVNDLRKWKDMKKNKLLEFYSYKGNLPPPFMLDGTGARELLSYCNHRDDNSSSCNTNTRYSSDFDLKTIYRDLDKKASASAGCGDGTVLVDGVCDLAYNENESYRLQDDADYNEPESSGGCGEGTELVNGVCQLTKTSGTSQEDSFGVNNLVPIIILIIAIVGTIALVKSRKKKSSITQPAPEKIKPKPSQKPAESRPTSSSCSNCGKKLKPTAKFCGGCGTKV